MKKIARRFRRPTVAIIKQLEATKTMENVKLAQRLWEIRAGMASRYETQATRSQQQRRKQMRRRHPHGF